MANKLRRGDVLWADLDPATGREQSGRRPVLVIASDDYLAQADALAIILPATSVDRGWPNHVELRGPGLTLSGRTFAMTEQPRTVSRERLVEWAGSVDAETLRDVDMWLRDFLGLPAALDLPW